MQSKIERITIDFRGRKVIGRRLTVSSELPIPLELAWQEVQKSSLLKFVAKGRISFKPIERAFPERWQEGTIVKAKMLFYGILPLGGIHIAQVVRIDDDDHKLISRESDRLVKVWNHTIHLQRLEANEKTHYVDQIEIYAGWLTGMITRWAKHFYQHRQRRWLLLVDKITSNRMTKD